MNYQVLARKWRPKQFSEMVGQQHVLPALIHALEQNRLHHAYLFTGTRGVGKTTVARIFAKCLNCKQGITATPCGSCENCLDIDAGRFIDLIEVDAASRTKVEDTRELLENVQYAPTRGRFKIYLIDEVHMLSNHSFNALLKTLEEPPEHVKFLLATTDPQKLPITVLSRCLQFHMKSLTHAQLITHCQTVCNEEKIPVETTALTYLADAAQGSLRDALSLLDQAIVFSNNNITEQAVCQMLGQASHNLVWEILEKVQTRNLGALLEMTENMALENTDFGTTLQALLEKFHAIAMAQFSPQSVTHDKDKLIGLAEHFTKETVQLYYQILLIGLKDFALTPNPKQGFEMVLLRLLSFSPSTEKQPHSTQRATSTPKPNTSKPAVKKQPVAGGKWAQLLAQLNLSGMAQLVASNCSLINQTNNELTLLLDEVHSPLLSSNVKERLQESIAQQLGPQVKLKIEIGPQTTQTPAKQKEKKAEKNQETATQSILKDQHVNQLMDAFGASIQEETIKFKTDTDNK